jgi:DegV family protein with EDD domain
LAPEVKIVTDSTSYLLAKTLAEYDIHVVPIKIAFGTEVFSEGVDITNEEFYRRLAESSRLPTTSQPPVGDFVEVYSRLSSLGHPIFSIHLSAKLSGTVNSALAAREKFPQAQIEVVDWLSMGMGLLVTAAARAAEAGESLAQIKAKIGQLAPCVSIFAMVDTLKYAWRGGRIGAGKALFGSLLNIKPVLALENAEAKPLARARSRAKGVEYMLKLLEKRVGRGGSIHHIVVFHSCVPEEALALEQKVRARCHCTELDIIELGPVFGSHLGPGALGLAFYTEKDWQRINRS